MTITLSSADRDALANLLADTLDAGAGAGTIAIRSGTRPANPNTTATGTLLATIILADPAFGAASSGVCTLTNPAGVTAVATGTASWCRFFDSDGTARFDGRVTATGGGGDLTLNSTSVISGQTVDVTGGTVTQPLGTAD